MADSFAFMDLALVQLGHGVTALVGCLALAEDEQDCLVRVLRESPSARGELSGTGYRLHSPEAVKAEQIAAERARIRNNAAAWIKKNLPGAFSARNENPPMWDFITSESDSLVKDIRGEPGWQDALGFRGARRWSLGSSASNISLGIPISFMDESCPVPTFWGLRQALIDEVRDESGGDSIYSVVQSLDDDLSYILSVWAAVRAVESYDRALSVARDGQLPRRPGYRAARSQLQHLRGTIFPAARDLVTLEELGIWLDDAGVRKWFQQGANDLEPSGSSDGDSMVEHLIDSLARESTMVRERADNDARSLQAYSETLVAASNLRLQLTVLGLSVIVAILTAVTIILAINRESETSSSKGQSPELSSAKDR